MPAADPGGPPRAGTTREAVLAELRRRVLDGEFAPGRAIDVEEVAAAGGVSRVPVREALMTLVGEGLVEHRPRQGYAVARLRPDELDELYEVRGILELAELRRAATAPPEALAPALQRARAALVAVAAALEAGGELAHHRSSRAFHMALVGPCAMPRLLRLFATTWDTTDPHRPMRDLPHAEGVLLVAEHAAMLAALEAGDVEGLCAAADAHLRRLHGRIGARPAAEDEPGPLRRVRRRR
ncbi:GntR family transcriptional regulator [Kineococcus glutinatus]|uniref:GntR family transcriptional regulator n=1 Tax=Kineococcus glutinatus TaxID=1070872 RepID=A0ABP9H9M4_9ACTN